MQQPQPLRSMPMSSWARLALLCSLLLITACTSLPHRTSRAPAQTLVAAADSPLAAVARDAGIAPGRSGLRAMPEADVALDARFALIRNATVSIDVQSYQIGNDSVGRSLLRALRDAARRGVRVRLLVDDFYTRDVDELLLGLAATPQVEVQLFNPFTTGRSSSLLRTVGLLSDFDRLNHRMHNKLLVADGAVAVVGGRNLADEYFFRHAEANFIDFDMLLVGSVVPQLSTWFDVYWNSSTVYPLRQIMRDPLTTAERQTAFDRLTSGDAQPQLLTRSDMYGDPPLALELSTRRFALVEGEAQAWADPPAKAQTADEAGPTVKQRFMQEMGNARRQLTLFSPYFIPGERGVASLKAARARGVEVKVVTNSLAASDEPLVNVGYSQYRVELLKAGVRLFEVASERLKSDSRIGRLLGATAGRLHAKMAYIDTDTVLVGSMNLDPRSEHINTEIGVVVHSPQIAQRMLSVFDTDRNVDYEVELSADGEGLVWVSRSGSREDRSIAEPGNGWWQRLKLRLMWMLVSEDLL